MGRVECSKVGGGELFLRGISREEGKFQGFRLPV